MNKKSKASHIAVRLLLASLLIVMSVLSSCQANGNTTESAGTPKRVAVLFSSLAEVWREAGGEIAITVGETVERGFAPSGTPLVDAGAGKAVNLELLIALEPDLVICSADVPAQVEAARILEQAGIRTLLLRIETFEDYLATLRCMTDLTQNTAAYKRALTLQAQIQSIKDQATGKGKTFLFVRAGSSASSTKAKSSAEHFAAAMLCDLGCVNIADAATFPTGELNMEYILLSNPDYIFFSTMGDEAAARQNIDRLLATDVWQSLQAVQNGNIHILPKSLFHYKPNASWGSAYTYLAEVLDE